MLTCCKCGREMRAAFLTVNGQTFGPRCGRPMLVRKQRRRRADAGLRRGRRIDVRQLDIFAGLPC